MNTTLWIIQIILSIMMLVIGFIKTSYPLERLNKFSWTTRSSKGFVRFVGVSELLIGLGLILPELTGILPILTPLAAVSLCVIMVLATIEHINHNEKQDTWKNVIVFLLAGFIAIGRFILLRS